MRRLIITAALFASPVLAAPDPTPVLEADRAFAALARAQGPTKAFDTYLADDVTGVAGGYVFTGKGEFLEEFQTAPEGFAIDWSPTGGAISEDGKMGSTWGEWTRSYPTKDGGFTKTRGAYFTLWRKQPDGRWLVVVDGGSARAAPKP
jgi:ketosteroid isomerase-like protein